MNTITYLFLTEKNFNESSKESQAAYRKFGCIEATEINQVIAENEPYDVQMEFVL